MHKYQHTSRQRARAFYHACAHFMSVLFFTFPRNILYNAVIPESHNPSQLGFKCKSLYNCAKERKHHTMSGIAVGNLHILLLFTIYPPNNYRTSVQYQNTNYRSFEKIKTRLFCGRFFLVVPEITGVRILCF